MLYTVECDYTDPVTENEWNAFYSQEKLPALVSVTGFKTSQRFKALTAECPVYLAIHSISHADVIHSEEYRLKGGGNFARWQTHISNWHRNIYDGISVAPAIKPDELLVLSAQPLPASDNLLLAPCPVTAIALEQFPQYRWLSKTDKNNMAQVLALSASVHLYEPITHQLMNEQHCIN